MTSIPAGPGFVMIIPLFDDDGIGGLAAHPHCVAHRGQKTCPDTATSRRK
jgi:hypothetical protein